MSGEDERAGGGADGEEPDQEQEWVEATDEDKRRISEMAEMVRRIEQQQQRGESGEGEGGGGEHE